MIFKKSINFVVLLLCTTLVHIQAQDLTREPGSMFRVACLGNWTGPEIFARDKGEWKPIETVDMAYSSPVKYSHGDPVVLARKVIVKDTEEFQPIITATVPPGCRYPLILIHASEDGKTFQHYVTDIDPSNFPYGGYKLLNFTSTPISARFGNKKFTLESGGIRLVAPGNSTSTRFSIQIAQAQKEENWKLIYSNMVMNRPSKRMFLFLVEAVGDDPRSEPEVRCLVDFRHAE